MRDKNFHIEKSGRFAVRFFQFIICFILWFFIGRLGSTFMSGDIINFLWFLTITSPIAIIWNVGMYSAPIVLKSWTSRRIIIIEGLLDIFMTVLWVATFIAACVYVAPHCAPGHKNPTAIENEYCARNNWVVLFAFLETSAWIVSVLLDLSAFYSGVVKKPDVDPEALLEIRRSARGHY
jgi:hypothetical protein